MLRGYVLRHLARVAGGGISPYDAARELPAALRALVVRRARGAVIASGFETERSSDDAHVHRLAYLRTIGVPAIDPNDEAAVRARFEQHRRKSVEASAGLRFLASTIVLALVGAGIAVGLRELRRPAPIVPIAVAEEEPPPPPPEPEHPLLSFFRDRFPEYVIALDARSADRERPPPGDVATTRATLLEAGTALAPGTVPALTGLLDASESFSSHGAPYADEAWLNALVLYHDALAAADAPFYVDAVLSEGAYSGRRRVLFSTYRITERHRYRSGELEIPAIFLERIDTLNFSRSLLGYTRPEICYAIVLVDRIERFLVTQLFPSMSSADESVFVHGYEDERDTHWVTDFETWAHEDLAAEARTSVEAAGLDPRLLSELAGAIVSRRHAIDAVTHGLRDRGIELLQPATYDYDVDRISGLRAGEAGSAARDVAEAQRTLSRPEIRAVYDAVLSGFLLAIASHEAQHRVDYVDDRLVHVPDALSDLTGETVFEDRVNHLAERANAELSAYLAQAAREPAHVRTSLLHVASFVMDRESWNLPEASAAVVVFDALADAAGLVHDPLVADRSVVRSEISAIYGALRGRDDLPSIAARGWSALYGAELPPLTRLD